ncbi:hypothetical protein [Nocardioides panacihumi]|uniref:hypothetical protein n=1 Tax=Nocardioides panacihumi TaxID=400774 RepID=UPI0031D8B66D
MNDKDALIGTDHLGWVTKSGFEPFDYADRETPPHQIAGATIDGENVAWVETTSTDLFHSDWRIYAAEMGRRGRTLVADSAAVYGKRMLRWAFGETVPVVLGSRVYWPAVPPGGDAKDTRVLYDDLDGSAARPRVLEGALPATNGRRLFVVRQHLADPSKGDVRIISRTPTGAESVVQRFRLASGQWVTALAASRTHLAWVVKESDTRSSLYVEGLTTGKITGIVMHHGGADTMALGVGRNLIAWGNGSGNGDEDPGEYVYRPRTGALVRLGEQLGHSVAYANGPWIAWAQIKQHGASGISRMTVSH